MVILSFPCILLQLTHKQNSALQTCLNIYGAHVMWPFVYIVLDGSIQCGLVWSVLRKTNCFINYCSQENVIFSICKWSCVLVCFQQGTRDSQWIVAATQYRFPGWLISVFPAKYTDTPVQSSVCQYILQGTETDWPVLVGYGIDIVLAFLHF